MSATQTVPRSTAVDTAESGAAALPRVLVVDDERSMRELLAIVLKREGYEVLLAENGRMAITGLSKFDLDPK